MPANSSFQLPEDFRPPARAVRCDISEGSENEVEIEREAGGLLDVPRGSRATFVDFPAGAIRHPRARYYIGRPAGGYLVIRLRRAGAGDGSDRFDRPVRVRLRLDGCEPEPGSSLGVQKVRWGGDWNPEGDPIEARRNGQAPFIEFDLDRFSAYVVVQI